MSRIKSYNFKENERVIIYVKNCEGNLIKKLEGVYLNRMMDHPDESLIIYPGSSLLDKTKIKNSEVFRKSGLIEIGLVGNTNSAKELGISIGDIIEFE